MTLRFQVCMGLMVTIWLAGCASRPSSDVLIPVAHAPSYTGKVEMLVATTREHTPDDANGFGTDRSKVVNHASVTVSIPRAHKRSVTI
jgi:esterase/lipase superfamily enzyme